MTKFEEQVMLFMQETVAALKEVRSGLQWPASEHLSYDIESLENRIREVQKVARYV